MFLSSWNQLQSEKLELIATINQLPTQEEFKADLQNLIWDDVVNYMTIAISISTICFLLNKISG